MMRFRDIAVAALTTAAVALGGAGAHAQGSKPQTPTTLDGGKVVSAAEAKALLDGRKAQFFDTRSPMSYGKGHVPGAKALPYGEKSEFTEKFDPSRDRFDLAQLPGDKSTALVFYSDGPTGWKSYKAAVQAIRAGYTSVHYLRGGWAEWEAKKLPAN